MPTTVVFTFPWGRYHGTPWGRNANEGVVDWPPEPWRVSRALYATWRARAPELPADVVAALLDALAEPPSYVVPAHTVAHTRHYFPDAKHGTKGGGTDKVFDTFAVMERGAELHVTWPVDLDPPASSALAILCERVTYLGRADSICTAQLAVGDSRAPIPAGAQELAPVATGSTAAGLQAGTEPTAQETELGPAIPGTSALPGNVGTTTEVLVPRRPLDLTTLEARPQRLRKAGHLDPPGARRVAYPAPGLATPVRPSSTRRRDRAAAAVRLRLTTSALPSVHNALAVTDLFRKAAIKAFDPQRPGRSPLALFGKDEKGNRKDTGHQHAHYLAFTSAESDTPHLLDTIVVWVPGGDQVPDLSEEDIAALEAVRHLDGYRHVRGLHPCRVAVEAVGDVAGIAPEIAAEAKRWTSLTPYPSARHAKSTRHWEDRTIRRLRSDLQGALKPPPASITLAPGDWLAHRRHRLDERLPDARRATGLTIEFEQEEDGPLVLGGLRHLGLGLFHPEDVQ